MLVQQPAAVILNFYTLFRGTKDLNDRKIKFSVKLYLTDCKATLFFGNVLNKKNIYIIRITIIICYSKNHVAAIEYHCVEKCF